MRAGVGNVIDVETRVHFECRGIDIVEDVACIIFRSKRVRKDRERSWGRWKLQVLVVIVCIATGVCLGAYGLHESLIEEEQVGPVFNERNDDNYSVSVDALEYDRQGTCLLAAQSHRQGSGR